MSQKSQTGASILVSISAGTDQTDPSRAVRSFSLFFFIQHEFRKRKIRPRNFFSYSTQLSMKFILLINHVEVPLIIGILTFIRRINTSVGSNARKICIFQHLVFVSCPHSCSVKLSMGKV